MVARAVSTPRDQVTNWWPQAPGAGTLGLSPFPRSGQVLADAGGVACGGARQLFGAQLHLRQTREPYRDPVASPGFDHGEDRLDEVLVTDAHRLEAGQQLTERDRCRRPLA